MDDERLKNLPGPGQTDYFDEQLARIRDIRSSERRFYQKVLDIYATSVDYTPNTDVSQQFFATVQNKMPWAAHGHTAAEVIHSRVDAGKPIMGLQTTRPGLIIRQNIMLDGLGGTTDPLTLRAERRSGTIAEMPRVGMSRCVSHHPRRSTSQLWLSTTAAPQARRAQIVQKRQAARYGRLLVN